MSFRIPLMRPTLPNYLQVEPLLRQIDISHSYSNGGPLVRELESKYAEYLGTRSEFVVAVSNATLALQGVVQISNIKNWYAPDYTFAATGLAILNAGAKLHLTDVDPYSWKLDPSVINSGATPLGLMPVIPFGAEVEFKSYEGYENVLIDAAASLGRTPPKFSDMPSTWSVVYSLHATKVLGSGEGAIVVCGNSEVARNLRAWINFGFDGTRISRLAGTNAKMSEFHAAYALTSLRNYSFEQEQWLIPQSIVSELSVDRPWSTWVNQNAAFQPYWLGSFGNEENKRAISIALANAGIESRSWWVAPLSKQPAFRSQIELSSGEISSKLASSHLGLPMFTGLNANDVRIIISVIESTIKSENLLVRGANEF
jgi:dTDP-4-amino-4,6-dideoxygalactose transaminase